MDSVERVARAFYEAEHETGVWQKEHESLKEEFRRFAREAIHHLKQQEEEGCISTATNC
jgi:hypothetical protein